jgi:hypothetical protein
MSFSQGITRNNCREPRGAETNANREPRAPGRGRRAWPRTASIGAAGGRSPPPGRRQGRIIERFSRIFLSQLGGMSFSQGITRNNCREPRGAENRGEPRRAGSRDARQPRRADAGQKRGRRTKHRGRNCRPSSARGTRAPAFRAGGSGRRGMRTASTTLSGSIEPSTITRERSSSSPECRDSFARFESA